MKNQNLDFETFEDINEEEFSKITAMLNVYNVNFPGQEDIDESIEVLRQYVPKKQPLRDVFSGKISGVIYNAVNEMKFMSKYFWITSFILFLVSFYIVQTDIDINIWYKPYIMIMLVAPIPFLLGIIEVCRGRDEGMLEIELSCKISERDIILSKLIVIGIYNIILNTILSVMLSSFNIGVDIFRAAFFWITPFTTACGFALVLSSKIRGGYTATVLVSSWAVFVISVLSQKQVIEKLITINLWAYILLSAAGIIFMVYQVKQILNRNIDLTGRRDKIDSKN